MSFVIIFLPFHVILFASEMWMELLVRTITITIWIGKRRSAVNMGKPELQAVTMRCEMRAKNTIAKDLSKNVSTKGLMIIRIKKGMAAIYGRGFMRAP